MTCNICNNLDPREHPQSTPMHGWPQATELVLRCAFSEALEASLAGCNFCNLLCKMLLHFAPDIHIVCPMLTLQFHVRQGCATNVKAAGINSKQSLRAFQLIAATFTCLQVHCHTIMIYWIFINIVVNEYDRRKNCRSSITR